ncbi:ABC transporter substrate-binding protein [Paenibacillus sp. FSL R7-0273]|uniref:extracellular solute-binding protein n=1 Tax=Paenibacillus sp. FSL R7-0273 TaxID=1536772 RepID=UPI0004F730ED|nr:extracellular solute-binding protein [Paenibacillus sp. FSL R7-0273]AIQ47446.1 ABC transporter substrate-binding protein [Paenibacillus sp. FSL R7-0273]OMF95995.1 ABC transporter substrate-binding protein [Paenibacillus sp. FSL R7-0273]
MNKKKYMGLSLALLVTASLAGACSNNNAANTPSKSPANSATSSPAAESAEGNYPDYSAGFKNTVTLDLPVYERAFENWNVTDNYYTQWIQKEFGDKYNVKVNFMPISRGGEVKDYQQLLAAGNAPAIIYHYDMPQAMAYYGENVMQPLDLNEVAHYAPTYYNNMKDVIEKYGEVDGKDIFLFASRPDYGNFAGFIRQDWVEKVGMKVEDLTSLEKFNEMLMKWKEAGLGTASAGLTANIYNYAGAFREYPMDPKEYAIYTDITVGEYSSPATEKWLRNHSYQYHNGLIDPEFYLRKDGNAIKAEFVAGRTGTFGDYMTSNMDVFEATRKNNPEAEFAYLSGMEGIPGGVEQPRVAPFPFAMIYGVNADTTAEERSALWMYLEWMSQPDNLFFLQNGLEGENYTLDADGIPVKNESFTGESALSKNNNKDYWCLVTEAPTYGSEEQTIKALKKFWTPPGEEDIVEAMFANMAKVKQREVTLYDPLFTVPIESVNEYKADLNNLFQESYLKVVMAPEDQFDKLYAETKEKYLKSGYQEILDEKAAAFDAGNIK